MKKLDISGSFGGGDEGSVSYRTPVEAANTLQSDSYYKAIDVIGEGEIEGLVDGLKSIYFDKVPLQNASGSYNFDGVLLDGRVGTPSQAPIEGFPSVETPVDVGNVELSSADAPTTRIISTSTVDKVRIILSIPALYVRDATNGDTSATSVSFTVQINEGEVLTKKITGKCTSTYQASVLLDLPKDQGETSWTIKLQKISVDATNQNLQNTINWTGYIEITDHKMIYPNTALVYGAINAKKFNGKIPTRLYHIKGLKVSVPNNYVPSTYTKDSNGNKVWSNYTVGELSSAGNYTGSWNGVFGPKVYTTNPVWCFLDLITNGRYGADFPMPDKWALYQIAQYCDQLVPDGKGGLEPRFAIGVVINTIYDAFNLFNALVAIFRGMMFWGPGVIGFSQDSPGEVQAHATTANVLDGVFNYEGSARSARHTAVTVSWNDVGNFFEPTIEVLEDYESIQLYGYKMAEVSGFGCYSQAMAIRVGEWLLDSEKHNTEIVKYTAGIDHAHICPGMIIDVADKFYSTERYGGRLVSISGTTVTLDSEVLLSAGMEYQISFTMPVPVVKDNAAMDNDSSFGIPQVQTKTITTISNGLGHSVIIIDSAFSIDPVPGSVWVVMEAHNGVDTTQTPRTFRVLANIENDGKFEITALFHDKTKYDRVELGIDIEPTIYYVGQPSGEIPTPVLETNPIKFGTIYTSTSGIQNTLVFSWSSPGDARITSYSVEYKFNNGAWVSIAVHYPYSAELFTVQNGTYEFRVQSVSMSGQVSPWVHSTFNVSASIMPDVTDLKIDNAGLLATDFTGKDIQLSWTASVLVNVPSVSNPANNWFKNYQVQVWVGGSLKRTESVLIPNYTYTIEKNKTDNGSNGSRVVTFKVYQLGDMGQLSSTAAVIVATNPMPNMSNCTLVLDSSYKAIRVTWNWITTDSDFESFKILLDPTTNPATVPITVVQQVGKNSTSWLQTGLEKDVDYSVKVIPVDAFGDGIPTSVYTGTVLALDGADVNLELVESITMSDWIDSTPNVAINSTENLKKLYNRKTSSDGLTYTIDGTRKFVQYSYNIETYFDKLLFYTNVPTKVFFAYSTTIEPTENDWIYLGTDGTHLVSIATDTNGELTVGTKTFAEQNYLQGVAGMNRPKLPPNVTAKHIRMYLTSYSGSYYDTTLYEFIPVREVISEQIVADNLSAISANLGTVTTGSIQSPNYNAANKTGTLIDISGGRAYFNNMEMHFSGTGGNSWSDKVTGPDVPAPYSTNGAKLGESLYDATNSVIPAAALITSEGISANSLLLAGLDVAGLTSAVIQDDFIQNLKNQIDGTIDTWFKLVDPTDSNVPWLDWRIEDDTNGNKVQQEAHLMDVYYNSVNGGAWRFIKTGSVYSWDVINNSEFTAALAQANVALYIADGKRSTFFSTDPNYTPGTPISSGSSLIFYDIGDLWIKNDDNGVKSLWICNTAISKSTGGTYNAAHWQLATDYTKGAVVGDNLVGADGLLLSESEVLNIHQEWTEVNGIPLNFGNIVRSGSFSSLLNVGGWDAGSLLSVNPTGLGFTKAIGINTVDAHELPYLSCTPEEWFYVSAYISTKDYGFQIGVGLAFFDAQKNGLSWIRGVLAPANQSTPEWQQYIGRFQAPSNAVFMCPWIHSPGADGLDAKGKVAEILITRHEIGATVGAQLGFTLYNEAGTAPLDKLEVLTALNPDVINYNTSNDHDNFPINTLPIIATNGTALDHVINSNGSCDISFEWSWLGDQSEIDGFIVSVDVYSKDSTPVVEKGDSGFVVTSDKRAFVLTGVSPDKNYKFGVCSYRTIDKSPSYPGRIVKSTWVHPTRTDVTASQGAESPYYKPSTEVAFLGEVKGTISGTATIVGGDAISVVVSNAAAGAEGAAGTENYRNDVAPNSTITNFTNTPGTVEPDGSVVCTLTYTYTVLAQNSYPADVLFIFVKEGTGTLGVIAQTDFAIPTNPASGVNTFKVKVTPSPLGSETPSTNTRYCKFGIQQARRTEAGLRGTTIINSITGVTQVPCANYTGKIAGTLAETVVYNSEHAVGVVTSMIDDDTLDVVEKSQWRTNWDNQMLPNYTSIIDQAALIGVNTSALVDAKSALLTSLISFGVWSAPDTPYPFLINGAVEFLDQVKDYYTKLGDVALAITNYTIQQLDGKVEIFFTDIDPSLTWGQSFTKTSGAVGDWDSQCYTQGGLTDSFLLSFIPGQIDKVFRAGMDIVIAGNAYYYCWSIQSGGVARILTAGIDKNVNIIYTTNTVFSISYVGQFIQFLVDGIVQYTQSRVTGITFKANVELFTLGAIVNSVTFINGTTSPSFTPYNCTISGTNTYVKHINDVWNKKISSNPVTYLNQKWTYSISHVPVYYWETITDSTAQTALNNAATAQNTANKKVQLFTSTPTVPYYVGDMYKGTKSATSPATGSVVAIYVCTTERLTGNYLATDWTISSTVGGLYEDVFGGPPSNANNTQGVIQNGFDTASGYISFYSGTQGCGLNTASSNGNVVAIWAGKTWTNRDTAPFRVNMNGEVTISPIDGGNSGLFITKDNVIIKNSGVVRVKLGLL